MFDSVVLEERIVIKEMRTRSAFAPDYTNLKIRISLLEKDETYIKIGQVHNTNAPYGETFEVHQMWEAKTKDPASQQTVLRK